MMHSDTVVEKLEPQCWEDAAIKAVDELFTFSNLSTLILKHVSLTYTSDNLENINKTINLYIDSKTYLNQNSDEQTKSDHQTFIYTIAHSAIKLTEELCKDSLGIDIFKSILVDTLIRKQRDYGPSNITKFAITGIVIRMYDKIGRLSNLSLTGKDASINETLFDTTLDLVGYCSIAHMWINGTFPLPMDNREIVG